MRAEPSNNRTAGTDTSRCY